MFQPVRGFLLFDGGTSEPANIWKRGFLESSMRFSKIIQMWIFQRIAESRENSSVGTFAKRAFIVFIIWSTYRFLELWHFLYNVTREISPAENGDSFFSISYSWPYGMFEIRLGAWRKHYLSFEVLPWINVQFSFTCFFPLILGAALFP